MAKTAKRADGRYQRQVYLGKIDGKRQYKVVYGKTEKEVEKKVREIKNQLDKGINIVESVTPFADCVKKWMSTLKFKTSTSQYHLYDYRISVFAKRLGNYPIRNIKPEDLQAVLNDIAINNPTTCQPSSYKTVLNYKNTIQLFYKYLTDNRYIDFDSSKSLTIPKQAAPKKDRRALTTEEQNRVRTFKHRGQLPAMIAMLCGLRRGEISALKWSDIDFKEKTITVSKSFDFKNNKVKLPKTAAGIRTVPMPEELIQFLKPLKGKKNSPVVTNTKGGTMTETNWRHLWESYLYNYNHTFGDFRGWKPTLHNKKEPMVVEPFTMHCLRHTYATLLYDAEVDVMTARDLLGHSDVQTTMGIYTHLSEEKKRSSIEKLNDFLNSASQHASQKTV